MVKNTNHGKKRSETARLVAQLHGVTPRYVRMVINGERENEEITQTYIDYEQKRNKLIQHLQKLVPITSNPKRYAGEKN
jgi:hypothetical protein